MPDETCRWVRCPGRGAKRTCMSAVWVAVFHPPEHENGRCCGAGSVGAQKYKTKPTWLKLNKTNLNTLLNRDRRSSAGGVFSEEPIAAVGLRRQGFAASHPAGAFRNASPYRKDIRPNATPFPSAR
jgi:hypothetical protein